MNIYPDHAARPPLKAVRSASPRALQVLLPLLAGSAAWVLAINQADPAAAAESRYLALLIASVLCVSTVLSRGESWHGVGWPTGLGLVAAPLLAWAVPHGPHRGAAICLLLTTVLTLAAVRRGRRHTLLDLPSSIALCLGCQLLTRSDILLTAPQSPRTVAILLSSILAGLALALLAKRHGERRALYAGAATLLLGAGLTVTGAGMLLALAAGSWLGKPGKRHWWALAGLLPIVLWNPLLGGLTVAAALSLVGGWWQLAPAAAIGAVVTYKIVIGALPASMAAIMMVSAIGLALVPTLVFVKRQRYGQLAGALALIGGAGWLTAGLALLPGVALASLTLPRTGVGARLQGIWLLFASFCGGLMMAYPWLDPQPFTQILKLLGLGPEPISILAWVAVVTLLGWVLLRLDLDLGPWPDRLIWLLLFALLGLNLPAASRVPLDYQVVALESNRPPWSAELDGGKVGQISIDCNVVNGAGLVSGTPVMAIQLLDASGKPLEHWTLASGVDTAEWAAARPDVAALPGFQAPPPWLAYVAPGGGFFGHRYRSRLTTSLPHHAARLVIRRAAGLGPEVTPVIYRVELRP